MPAPKKPKSPGTPKRPGSPKRPSTPKSPSKPRTPRSVADTPPLYLKIGGYTYERLSTSSVDVAFDLADDVIEKLDALVRKGHFVSRGDAVRHILRAKLESTKAE